VPALRRESAFLRQVAMATRITCGVAALIPMYLWYHFDGTLILLIKWLAFVWILWFVLFFVSYRLVPPQLALAPQDGPIRLDL
jgi:hypothetical protein